MKAAIYARVSLDATGEHMAVDRQLADCRALAVRRGWDVLAEHVDNSISAYSGKHRPGFAALMRDMSTGSVEAVVAWHPDRITRNPRELEDVLDAIEDHDLAVATVTAGDVDLGTPSGRAVARTLTAWAKHESEHKAQRQRRAMVQAAEQGKRHGRTPFGWRDPAEGDVVRRIVRGLLAGDTIRSLMRELNDGSVPAPAGGPWTSTSVRQTATRWSNAGKRAHHGTVVGDGQWPALVTEDEQERVLRLLADPTRRVSAGGVRVHLLSGVLRCGVCGDVMRWASTGIPGGRFKCAEGSHVSIVATKTTEYVLSVAQARLDAAALQPPEDDAHEALSGRLQALRGRLDDLAQDYADGVLDRAQVRVAGDRLREQVAEVEAQLRQVEQAESVVLSAGDRLAEVSMDRQRRVIETLMDLAVLPGDRHAPRVWSPERVAITWKQ